jgi:hypothetical protein
MSSVPDIEFLPGDHLWKSSSRFWGTLYDHHLIYAERVEGGHKIIENSGRAGQVQEKILSDDQLAQYALYERPVDAGKCLSLARSSVGERYSLLTNNCEAFANRCVDGLPRGSRQVRMASGHLALLSTAICSGTTAMSVGLVTTEAVKVAVPSKSFFGLAGDIGYTINKTILVTQPHPLGIAAASGASCACCFWGCFAAFFKDPRKNLGRCRLCCPCCIPKRETAMVDPVMNSRTQNGSGSSQAQDDGKASMLQVVVGPEVEKIGLAFIFRSPEPALIKRVNADTWAEGQDIKAGDILQIINGRPVPELSKEEFAEIMQQRPLTMHIEVSQDDEDELDEAEKRERSANLARRATTYATE